MESEILKRKIESMYPGIYNIPEDEIGYYMEYCDNAPPQSRDYQSFKKFNEMMEKCRKKGLESILFRKDVINVSKNHYKAGYNDAHDVEYDYIEVITDYGRFRVTKGNQVIY